MIPGRFSCHHGFWKVDTAYRSYEATSSKSEKHVDLRSATQRLGRLFGSPKDNVRVRQLGQTVANSASIIMRISCWFFPAHLRASRVGNPSSFCLMDTKM